MREPMGQKNAQKQLNWCALNRSSFSAEDYGKRGPHRQ
jgi:hypothetical protein